MAYIWPVGVAVVEDITMVGVCTRVRPAVVLACTGETVRGRHWLMNALPSLLLRMLPVAPVDLHIGTNRVLRTGLLLLVFFSKSAHDLKTNHFYLLCLMDMNCVLVHWPPTANLIAPLLLTPRPPQRNNERFAQGGPRGMGPGNPGYGRVREEFDGPTKKPRF